MALYRRNTNPDGWGPTIDVSASPGAAGNIPRPLPPAPAQTQQQQQPRQGGGSLPIGGLLGLFQGGGQAGAGGAAATPAAAASAAPSAGGATSSASPILGGVFSNPVTGIVGAAAAGATALSADSVAAGNGGNWEKWGGPLVNIPMRLANGDVDGAMSDGAMGPIGAAYNIASGKDVLTSMANSLGPAGQAPMLLAKGVLPFSGGDSSKQWINALTGFGL